MRWIYHEPDNYQSFPLRFKERQGEFVISHRKIYTDYNPEFVDEEVERLQFLIRQGSLALLEALRAEVANVKQIREKYETQKRFYK